MRDCAISLNTVGYINLRVDSSSMTSRMATSSDSRCPPTAAAFGAETFWMSLPHPSFAEGFLTDPEYRREDCCLMVSTSSIATKKFGLIRDVYEKYPYADVITVRRREGEIAVRADRVEPGSIILCKPPPVSSLPYVLNMVTQYGYGPEFADNRRAQEYLSKNKEDRHLEEGLISDTLLKRRKMFQLCLNEFTDIVRSLDIQTFILPLGFAHRGVADDVWMKYYYPDILDFHQRLLSLNKKLIVLYSKHQQIPHDLKCLL